MNATSEPAKPTIENPWAQTRVADELTRVKIFLGIHAFFLVVSVFTGGFNFKLWSMLDTALMIQSIGVTALVVVLEEARHRRHQQLLAQLGGTLVWRNHPQADSRGTFQSVPELIAFIEAYLAEHNRNPKAFVWTKSAEAILNKIAHCKEALGTAH